MTIELAASDPAGARRELLATWAKVIALLAVAWQLFRLDPTGLLRGNAAGLAAFLFIWYPDHKLHHRGERWPDHGFPWWGASDPRTWRAWARGFGLALGLALLVFPVFFAGFWTYGWMLPRLPEAVTRVVGPYYLPAQFHLRLPERPLLLVLNQFLVVALPEELFYRGWMQSTFAASHPERGARVFGARLGYGFLATQGLFALGHLVVPQPWRLATFFPGLIFGWLRERTGDLSAPIAFHALSNVFIAVLEAMFYGA